MTARDKITTPWSARVFTLVAGVALGVVIATALVYRHVFGTAVSTSSSEWNNFGTFFGGLLGPILSMLAFFALVYTIFLQEQQLSLARQAKDAADKALVVQSNAAREEAARSTFFEMIKLHHEIVNGMSGDDAGKNYTGRAVIQVFMYDFFLPKYKIRFSAKAAQSIWDFDRDFCTSVFKSEGSRFSHYFRNLFQMMVYVECGPYQDREQLRVIMRAQLSDVELLMIFYFGLSPMGRPLKYRIEHDSLFKGFNQELIYDPTSYQAYNPMAWGTLRIPYAPPESWS